MQRSPPGASDQLGSDALFNLLQNIQYQRARAKQQLAICSPAQSNDRIDALTQAITLLNDLRAARVEGSLRWDVQLGLARCYRLSREPNRALESLQALADEPLPQEYDSLREAELLRQAISRRDIPKLKGYLGSADSKLHRNVSGDLALAQVQAIISLWEDADRRDDDTGAKLWQKRVAQAVEAIDQRFGRYWSRRAESLMTQTAAQRGSIRDLDILDRTARNHFFRKRFDDAVLTYASASQVAQEMGDQDRAFDFAFRAATIDHERKNYVDSQQRFRQLSLAMPGHAKASEAHLLAVIAASERVRDQPDDALLSEYVSLLDEHIRKWPTQSTADQARWWLARLSQHQQDWLKAAGLLEQISGDFPESEKVLDTLAACYLQWLKTEATAKPRSEAQRSVNQVLIRLERLASRFARAGNKHRHAQATLMTAEVALRFQASTVGPSLVQEITAIQSDLDIESIYRSKAIVLLIVAYLRQAQWSAARDLVGKANPDSEWDWGFLIESVSQLSRPAANEQAIELGEFLLDLIRVLRASSADQLSQAEVNLLNRLEARSFSWVGRTERAIELYEANLSMNRENAALEAEFAQALVESGDLRLVRRSLERWRRLAARARPESELWFQAKYAIALAHHKLGDSEKAASMIRLTRALHPKLGGDRWESKFERLLEVAKANGAG